LASATVPDLVGNRQRRGNVELAPDQNLKGGVGVRRLLLVAIPLLLVGCATDAPGGRVPAQKTRAQE
jgi:hypothetical protein